MIPLGTDNTENDDDYYSLMFDDDVSALETISLIEAKTDGYGNIESAAYEVSNDIKVENNMKFLKISA